MITKQQKKGGWGMVNSTSTFHIPQFEGCFCYILLNPRDSMTRWSSFFNSFWFMGPPRHHFMHIVERPTSLTSITLQSICLKWHFFFMLPANNAWLHVYQNGNPPTLCKCNTSSLSPLSISHYRSHRLSVIKNLN